MGEWKEYKLGDLTTKIGSGATPTGGDNSYKSEGISLIRSQNVLDFQFSYNGLAFIDDEQADALRNVTVESGDVLLNITGDSVARVCKVPGKVLPARVNQHVAIIRAEREKLDSDYLLYFMQAKKEYLLSISEIGATRRALTKGMLEDLDLTIPDLPEQKSIASILSSLDDKIDLLHRQNKTLEALAETLFRQWFVEAAEEGWETGKLGDYASVTTGKGLKRDEFIDNGIYPVLGANGEMGRTNNYLTDDRLILTGRVGTLGKVYINEDKVWISDNVLIVKPIESIYFYPIYFILKRTEFENLNVGSTQPLVTQTDLKNIEFKLPSADILESYEKQCLTYFEKISKNKVQIRTLTRLRDMLLPKLMSGEVRIRVAESALSKASHD